MSLQPWHSHHSFRSFRGKVLILQKDLAFPSAFWSWDTAEVDSEHHKGMNSSFHISTFQHILYFFPSPEEELVNPGERDWFFISSPRLLRGFFWVSATILVTFWCGKLLIPNIFMWAIKKPWLSLIYRSGCAELAAACPKKVQKSEFARFLLEGILLRINFLLTFSVCGEEKQVTSESQHPGLSDSS